MGGHYFVKQANLTGNTNLIQSGENLPILTAGGDKEKTKTSAYIEQAITTLELAGPDPAFKLGEVYVFPNPAKGAENPTFHLQFRQ